MDASVVTFAAYFANSLVQFADHYLTSRAISAEKALNLKSEANPLTRWMIAKLGVAGSGAVKFGALPIIGVIVELASKYPASFNGTIAAITFPVVIWNVIQLKRKKISIL